MADLGIQINAKGSNVSARRRGNDVVIDIDNSEAKAATALATQAATRADEAAGRAEDALAQVEADVQAAINQFAADQEQLQALADILVPSGATATFRDSDNLMLLGDML